MTTSTPVAQQPTMIIYRDQHQHNYSLGHPAAIPVL